MRYAINFDKQVNRLVPYYLGGRKLILYLQALVKPLQALNDAFVAYAKETRIEASMTSQIGYFEWYLNRKYSKYFADSTSQISITNGEAIGVPIYWGDAAIDQDEHMKLYKEEEGTTDTAVLYRTTDTTPVSGYSFIVQAPAVNTAKISKDEYLAMLKSTIDKYRIGNKTYNINYIEQ